MIPKNIETLIFSKQEEMYGYNYEVKLGAELFEDCTTLQEGLQNIKKSFPNSNPESINPVQISEEDFWKTINETFDYRGESPGVALILNVKQEEELKSKQKKYKNFITQFIDETSKIYNYQFMEGIPGYPVFWEYCFVVICNNKTCLFIYGSSSD